MKLAFWHFWISSIVLVILGFIFWILGYKEYMGISLAGALSLNTISIFFKD